MQILVKRIAKLPTYTIGKMYIDGKYFSDTLEDKDRGLIQSMSLSEIKDIKVYGETAIPTGTYQVTTNVISPKFSQKQFYKDICDGRVPRLMDVPGFEGILIHVADGPNGAKLIQGCIGIGLNTIKGGLTNGKETFKRLWDILKNKNNIVITIE